MKWLLPIVFILSISLLVGGTEAQLSIGGHTADDVFLNIEEKHADITGGYVIFNLKNPTALQMDFGLVDLSQDIVSLEDTTTTSVEYFYWGDVTKYKKVEQFREYECDKDGCYNWNDIITVPYVEKDWIPISELKLSAETSIKVKAVLSWKAEIGPQARDWIPKITQGGTTLSQDKWAWFNTTWGYKKSITINENDNKELLDYGIIISEFDCENNCQPDGSDIRVLNASEDAVLDFGLIRINDTAFNITFKFNVSASGSETVYVYYGNDTDVAAANVSWNDARYNWYDDFETNTTDDYLCLSDDMIWDSANGSIHAQSPTVYLQCYIDLDQMYLRMMNASNYIYTFQYYVGNQGGGNADTAGIKIKNATSGDGSIYQFSDTLVGILGLLKHKNSGGSEVYQEIFPTSRNSNHNASIWYDSSGWNINNESGTNVSDADQEPGNDTYNTTFLITRGAISEDGGQIKFFSIYAYVEDVPTYSVGAQELGSAPIFVDFVAPTEENGTEAADKDYIVWNASSNRDIYSCVFDINNTNYSATIFNGSSQSYCSINETGFQYELTSCANAYIWNDTGDVNVSEITVCRNIQFTDPVISWESPTTTNASVAYDQQYIVWNMSSTLDIANCLFDINGTNQSGTIINNSNKQYCYYNETGFGSNVTRCADAYGWSAHDDSDTPATTVCQTLAITYGGPALNFIVPTDANATEAYEKNYILWNMSANKNLSSCNFDINGTNQSGTITNANANTYCIYNETNINVNQTRCTTGYGNNISGDGLSMTANTICRNIQVSYGPPTADFIAPSDSNASETYDQTYILWNISSTLDIGTCYVEINGSNKTATQIDAGANSYCYYNETLLLANQTRCATGWVSNTSDDGWDDTSEYICRDIQVEGSAPFIWQFHNVTYLANVSEGDSQNIALYIQYNNSYVSGISGNLTWNNTNQGSTSSNGADGFFELLETFTTEYFDDNVTISFWFNYTVVYANASTQNNNSIVYTQGVENLYDFSLNLSFRNVSGDNITANGSLIAPLLNETWETHNLYKDSTTLGEGRVIVNFGDYQKFEYDNEDIGVWTDIDEFAYVMDNPDKNQEVVVWDGIQLLEGARIWVYRLIANRWMIVYGTYTDALGEAVITLESGQTYRFDIELDGYGDFVQTEYIIPSVEDKLFFEMSSDISYDENVVVVTTCGGLVEEGSTCQVLIDSINNISNLTIYTFINNQSVNETYTSTNVDTATFTYEVNGTYYQWTIHVYADGVLVAVIDPCSLQLWLLNPGYCIIDYYVSDPGLDSIYNITIDETVFNEGNLRASGNYAFFIMLFVIIAAVFAKIANQVAYGSGIYVYALMLSVVGTVLSVFYIPLAIMAFFIVRRIYFKLAT